MGPHQLVARADASPYLRSYLDGLDPLVEVPRELFVAVVAIGPEGLESGLILPGLEHEGGVGIADIKGPFGRHLHDDVAPGQLCHVASRMWREKRPCRESAARTSDNRLYPRSAPEPPTAYPVTRRPRKCSLWGMLPIVIGHGESDMKTAKTLGAIVPWAVLPAHEPTR